MDNSYQDWLNGRDCCCGGFIHIEPCDKHKDVCDCDNILLEISKLHTDDEVLQEQIDELSGCCSGGSGGCECDLSDYYTIEEVDDIADDIREEIPVIPTVVSAFINDMGYLTEHQPLSGYVTTSEFIQVTSNLQQQIDSLRSAISGCCGQTGQTYTRWITMTGENDYWCSGTTKMTKEKEQTSTDNVNWVDTGNIRNGNTVLEINSTSCGYVPPTPPSSYKVSLRYIDGTEDNRNCDGNTELKWINPSNWENISGATVGNCITSLGDLCFNGFSGLTSVSIPDTVTKFGGNAFNHCIALPSITIPSGVTSIGSMAFNYCLSLTDITIPNGVETLKYATLYYCSAMTSVTLSNSLRTIDNDAIKECKSLQTLTLPSTLTSIGKHAFAFGTSLTTVTCLATTPPAFHDSGETGTGGNSGDIFYGCHNLTAIYVPSGSVQAYKNAWPIYESLIQGIA